MSKNLVEINELSLSIGNLALTKEISFSIRANERIGLTGPSGCGKTTLLQSIIAQNFPQYSSFSNFRIEEETTFSYLPQTDGLLPWYSLGENLKIYSKNNSVLEEVLQVTRLGNNLNSFPNHLSGGEYQRSILACSIVNEPNIFIADEPLTELDFSNKWRLLEYWSKKVKDFNSSLLLVSHDIDTLCYLCDRIIVFSDKPSTIKQEIKIKEEHPRKLNFLVSKEFLDAKGKLLEIIE